ncbi:MAG: beta-Ala-His dipeptidase [Clostridiales Family XIII bacterium]|jgi:dipeptidase D|nr:beta-Ala-His dipeptidase [Clostridiales Family XIII bacterium]
MGYVLDHEGKPYAKLFEDISAIPRGSYKEQAIADFIVGFAENLGLEYTRDDFNNVVIKKPASLGYESHETVMLQGHTDMIWQKRPGSTFDFETQPIDLIVKDGWLMAKETTCGSDDGVAVAYMLAILAEKDWKHPPLECVFTTAEEAGLIGVQKLDFSQLKARKMISMDGNLEGTSLMLSGGGCYGDFERTVQLEKNNDPVLSIQVEGLTGGHSGSAMNREGANAFKILARILHYIGKEADFRLVDMEGGSISVIPTKARVRAAIARHDIDKAKEIAERVIKDVKFEHKESDPGIALYLETEESAGTVVSKDDSDKMTDLMHLLYSGMMNRSPMFDNIPLTSANLEMAWIEGNKAIVRYKPKSALNSKMLDQSEQASMLGELLGFEFNVWNCFFGHSIADGSPLFNVYKEVYCELTGKELQAVGAHYGCEIGTFLEKMPWLDVILVIATHYDAHTPDERLDIESFDRNYVILKMILERV